jgi:hypothetical protein
MRNTTLPPPAPAHRTVFCWITRHLCAKYHHGEAPGSVKSKSGRPVCLSRHRHSAQASILLGTFYKDHTSFECSFFEEIIIINQLSMEQHCKTPDSRVTGRSLLWNLQSDNRGNDGIPGLSVEIESVRAAANVRRKCHRGKTTTALLALAAVLALAAPGLRADRLVVCGGKEVRVLDIAPGPDGKAVIAWRWSSDEWAGSMPEERLRWFRTLDECKPLDGGRLFLVTSSSGGAALIERATKKCLFYASARNAHSAELLPGGKIVVARSDPDGALVVFDLRKPDKPLFVEPLASGHGVVWLNPKKRLYALGFDMVREYALEDWDGEKPSLRRTNEWRLAARGGHDLARLDETTLFVSHGSGVELFDVEKKKFSRFKPLQMPRVKSVSPHPRESRVAYTQAEEGDGTYWTYHVRFMPKSPALHVPDLPIYKVRWLPGE